MSTTSLRQHFADFGVDPEELDVRDLAHALKGLASSMHGDGQRTLFRLIRAASGPLSGDESETYEAIIHNGEMFVWWASDAYVTTSGAFLDASAAAGIQAWIAQELKRQEWGLGQFVGTEILNYASDLLPRAFFLRLLEEAEARHGMSLSDFDDESESLDAWLDENYRE
jgi:hypothetical protein